MHVRNLSVATAILITTVIFFNGCSKSNNGGANACANNNITVAGTPTATDSCIVDGSILVTASGGNNFTYNIDGGTFQPGTTFNTVAAGSHTIIAKDGNGCSKSVSVTVNLKPEGAQFAAVKTVIAKSCALAGCHGGAQLPDFRNNCQIASNAARIKARAVDAAGTPNQMPLPPNAALSQGDRDKITVWITGGSKVSN
jgi:hypothetical protein